MDVLLYSAEMTTKCLENGDPSKACFIDSENRRKSKPCPEI
jgi:hypothetical protein